MKGIFGLASLILYCLVGLICFVMAYTTLTAKKFLPFHEEAAKKKWEELESGIQETILTLIHLSGLGFLIVGLILTTITIISHFHPDIVLIVFVPSLSLIFCFGLFLFNFQLYKRTKANTPWQSSLIAIGIIIIGFGLSLAGK
jgi:hypothetical protein